MINAEKNGTYTASSGKTTDITLGSAYEINKNLVEKYEKELTSEELNQKKEELLTFLDAKNDNYYMLLCNDRKDYTVFRLVEDKNELINILVDECLLNRGAVKGIDLTEDKYAMEIWLSIDNEAFCYYFFPYGEAVIEV